MFNTQKLNENRKIPALTIGSAMKMTSDFSSARSVDSKSSVWFISTILFARSNSNSSVSFFLFLNKSHTNKFVLN